MILVYTIHPPTVQACTKFQLSGLHSYWEMIELGFNDTILCHLPEKGRKEIEEIVEEMKERDREERGTGMKVMKQKK